MEVWALLEEAVNSLIGGEMNFLFSLGQRISIFVFE